MTDQSVALDIHPEQQRVSIAVRRGADKLQAVAAGLALHP